MTIFYMEFEWNEKPSKYLSKSFMKLRLNKIENLSSVLGESFDLQIF